MSTVSHDSPMQLTVMGPRWTDSQALWSCIVQVLHHHVELNNGTNIHRATRPVFVPRANPPFVPTTIVARCRIIQASVRYGDDVDAGNGSFETTLLLGAETSDWFTDGFGDGHLRRAYCLAGEFPLKPFFSTVPPRLQDMLRDIVDDVARIQDLRATAGGLSFSARTKMPAGGAPIVNAPYLVEVELPLPVPNAARDLPTNTRGTVLVRLDRERLPRYPEGESSLRAYFANLVSRLNPADAVSKKPLLRWSRLDLADPTRIPEFQWRATRSVPKEFEFAQGMWRLTLSDQAAGMPGILPRSALVTSPRIGIKASGNQFEVKGKPDGGGDPLWNSLGPVRPEAEYKATFDQQQGWSENVSLRRVELGYDAVEVARQLRTQYGLKTPRTDDFETPTSGDLLAGTAPAADFSDDNIDPPVLWGFTPLHDGWAQLPFLNMTEQLFVDGLPDPAVPVPAERRAALFRGAVLFGNDGEAPLRRPGHIPWNMILTDARNYEGTWMLSKDGLQSASLRLDDPVVSTEGLFWLATDPPTRFDALPDQDNWLASLSQVPLKTPRCRPLSDGGLDENGRPFFESTDPYPSPFLLKKVDVSIDRLIAAELAEASLTKVKYDYQWSTILHRGTDRDYRILNLPTPAKPELITLSTEIPVWLSALPRSRFLQAEIWNISKVKPTDERVIVNDTAVARAQSPGLAWRRHPHHPFVQALPLTQNATPPNHFSPSRQLAPFELALTSRKIVLKADGRTQSLILVGPATWSFKSVETSIASADWPTIEDAKATKPWSVLPLLPMVSLGIPGVILHAIRRQLQSFRSWTNRSVPATTTTLLNQLDGLTGAYVAGDQIQISGTESNGTAVRATFSVTPTSTLGDLVRFLDATYTSGGATLGSSGKIILTADSTGPSLMSLKLSDASTNRGNLGFATNPMIATQESGVEDPSNFLNSLQYRIDLPYLDEPNALAELPSDATSAQPTSPPPALLRNDYIEHWRHLNDRGLLAAADAVESIIRDQADTLIVNVVEPLRWKVDVLPKLDAYPGEIIFKDKTSNVELKLSGNAEEYLFDVGVATSEHLSNLNEPAIKPWLTERFRNEGRELSSLTSIQVVAQNAEWRITQARDQQVYVVKIDAGTLKTYALATDALRGFDGGFTATSDDLLLKDVETDPTQWTEQPVRLVGGSFTATIESNGSRLVRDQRGLLRGASALLAAGADAPLRTPLQLKSRDPQTGTVKTVSCDLFTLRKPVALAAGHAAWRFWFKGLPMQATGGGFKFDRSLCVSRANGANDVGAMDREHGHLNGYEWVLAEGTDKDSQFLDLGRFHFYPLELESAELDSQGAVKSLRVLGRLQLVLLDAAAEKPTAWINRELSNLDAAVFLDFQAGRLHDISVAQPDADQGPLGKMRPHCWSPADPTAKPETPAILWNQIKYDRTAGAEKITINDWRIEYTRHGLPWTIFPALEAGGSSNRKSLTIPLAGTNKVEFSEFDLSTVRGPAGSAVSDSVRITKVNLTLFDGHRHDLDIDWQFQCGDQAKLQVQVTLTDRLLRDVSGTPSAQLIHLGKVVDLNINWNLTAREVIDRRALQVVWTGAKRDKLDDLHLLPGFRLDQSSESLKGFAIFNWDLASVVRTAGAPAAVEPRLLGATANMLFQCRWGNSLLQKSWEWGKKLDSGARATASQALFESSAGDVTAEYTIRFNGAGKTEAWASKLILTGLVEIKNLISWPNALNVDDRLKITVPGAKKVGQALGHWRHAMRLVLSEHEFPDKILQGGGSDQCFLTIKAGEVWTFAAICEHTLLSVEIEGHKAADSASTLPGLTVDRPLCERRWTCAQQVRLCSPRAVHDHLAVMGGRDTFDALSNSERWPNGSFNALLRGWYGGAFCRVLGVRNTENPSQSDFEASEFGTSLGEALIFEASAALFIRRSAVNTRPGTDLVQLIQGVVRGGLADLKDYQADLALEDSDEKQFLFAPVPFLGRSQVLESWDGAPLRTDPVLTVAAGGGAKRDLALMLAQWGDDIAVELGTAPLDIANERWFRRLNSSSLREAWHRLNVTRANNAQTATADVSAQETTSPGSGNAGEPPPVLSTGASDAATLLARGSALGHLFDARRMSLPPSELPFPQRRAAFDALVWSQKSLQTLRAVVERRAEGNQSFPFMGFPLIFQKSTLLEGKEKVRRHPAATLLPVPSDLIRVPIYNPDGTPLLGPDRQAVFSNGRQTLEPVSLVLSPVVSIDTVDFSRDTIVHKPLMAVGELVGFDTLGRRAVLVDSQISYAADGRTDFVDGFKKWGAAVHAQMAADSGVAVLRLRMLLAVKGQDNALLGLARDFSFFAVDITPDERDLVVRALPLRAAPPQLRTHEGQFRGTRLPIPLSEGLLPDYALAPPLVDGVQPIRLNGRVIDPPEGVPAWPWGVAGLRISTAYRRHADSPLGVVGPQFDGKTDGILWWQSLTQPVQFLNPADRQILPALFRATALPGFLPTWPHTPFPPSYALDEWIRDRPNDPYQQVSSWQSILPGGRVVLITGSRPGVPFAFRELLTTQLLKKPATLNDLFLTDADQVVQSASVPVQHRPPRPILIPASQKSLQLIALRTWGRWFDLDEGGNLDRTVIVESQPHDDAFLLQPGPSFLPAGGLRAALVRPNEAELNDAGIDATERQSLDTDLTTLFTPLAVPGEVNFSWDGRIVGTRQLLGDPSRSWTLSGTLTVGDFSIPLKEVAPDVTTFPVAGGALWTKLKKCLFLLVPDTANIPSAEKRFRDSLATAPQGMPIRVTVNVIFNDDPDPKKCVFQVQGYQQTLTFPLRFRRFDLAREVANGNQDRRIFSPRYLKFEDPEYNRRLSSVPAKATRNIALTPPTRDTIKFAADRTEYNPGDKVQVVYTRELATASDPLGLSGKINILRFRDRGLTELATINIQINVLTTIDLTEIGKGELRGEDNLVIRLKLDNVAAGQELELMLAIVTKPITPVPEAAYALLRANDKSNLVECVRFAWAPDPDRVELVCPDDILADVVRRRAVFRLTDTLRNNQGASVAYNVQKITSLGSTHFPASGSNWT